ncbi:MAG TPA: flagellar hook-basal body complex protein FliE [Syntrophorhabdus sp.]|jgi:flagellar hook-basal body complex protein FliE|nr:flagellar hook-basal body complex protein FliE [Syntrophorhabdus sp.]OQB78020.1 MAG: Flagellar hook-basal body complex protein FliE [Deltaproteobacteria bacterium ADurb.Bin135]HNQ45428.1 flagellar hook-basal body complex protein FliE [Syntrophorhabdus sp.]HNS77138.1 flagellar hook-basal body complex protein FliE [Syntrophorhabdus sp.]HNY69608.1 flagellar hook-basal body complex protein FliE [Syntrophorhabdus sp.]
MKIDSIAGIGNMVENKGVNTHKGKTTFSEVLKDSIQKAGELEKEADQEAIKLAKMETQDIHNTMIAIEKADLTFQLMMQVRNKIISAYEEIMRMQV